MSQRRFFNQESGNTGIIALVGIAIVAIGILAYTSTDRKAAESKGETDSPATAQVAETGQQAEAAGSSDPDVKQGNPVVAKAGGEEIKRLDVLNFIQGLPPQTRQAPIDQLYSMALEQVISAKIIAGKTKNVDLDNDPEVKKQLEEAKTQITRSVYLQKEVEKKIDDAKLKEIYSEYVKNFPAIEDVGARHILVKEEKKAKDLIKKLDGGADFAELAKENSTDGTAKNGGYLGYFAKADVVPEFGKAAFETKPGTYTKKPVKTEFGYHIIKTEETRKRPPAPFEEIKPMLEAQARRQLLDEIIQGWRDEANIERFDINGNPIEPASGTEDKKEPSAEKKAE